MASSLNNVILMGNLVRDADYREIGNNMQVTKLTLAVNHEARGKDGDAKKEVCFIDCTLWNKEAQQAAKLKKGMQILVQGRLKLEKWMDKNTNMERTKHTVVVSSVMYNDKLSDAIEEDEVMEMRTPAPRAQTPPPQAYKQARSQNDFDDMPF